MFQVQNKTTYSSFTVETRDELLFELDILDARQKMNQTSESFDLFYLDKDGRLLDKRSITFPLEGTVDAALVDFGYVKAKKPGFFKRLFSFKKKEKATELQVEANPTNEGASITAVKEQEEMSVSDLLTSTALTVEEEAIPETTLPEEEVTEEDETSVEVDSHDLDESESDNSDSIFDHVATPASPVDEEEAAPGGEDLLLEEAEVEEQSPFEVNDDFEKDERFSLTNHSSSSPILKVVESRDIESLTALRQKQSFELKLQEEVDQIDELIARLMKQRDGHLKLLHHIKQFTTD